MSELHVDPDKLIDSNEKEQLAKKFEDSLSIKTFTLSSNTAFDDSSDRQDKVDSEKRNKIYKMQSKINGLSPKKNTGKSVIKSDSESSLDPWFQHIDVEHDFTDECTDAGEACQLNDNCGGIARRQGASNLGESDSITEGPSQFREPRRRRKLKRMTVDPPIKTIKHDAAYFRRFKRNVEYKQMQKTHKVLAEGIFKPTKVPSVALTCGKRKRGEEKTTVYNDYNRVYSKSRMDEIKGAVELAQSCPTFESDSDSEVTKSENEREFVLSTTDESDESREADDEQSDFFLEASKRILASDNKNVVKEKKKRPMCSQERFLCNLLEQIRIPNVPAFHAIAERAYQRRKEEIRQHFENLKKEKIAKDKGCSKTSKSGNLKKEKITKDKICLKTSKSVPKSGPDQPKSEFQQPKSEFQQPRNELQQPRNELQQPRNELQQLRNELDNSREFIRGRRRLANAKNSVKEEFMTEDSKKDE